VTIIFFNWNQCVIFSLCAPSAYIYTPTFTYIFTYKCMYECMDAYRLCHSCRISVSVLDGFVRLFSRFPLRYLGLCLLILIPLLPSVCSWALNRHYSVNSRSGQVNIAVTLGTCIFEYSVLSLCRTWLFWVRGSMIFLRSSKKCRENSSIHQLSNIWRCRI
jgi:hypothetical protein